MLKVSYGERMDKITNNFEQLRKSSFPKRALQESHCFWAGILWQTCKLAELRFSELFDIPTSSTFWLTNRSLDQKQM